MADTKRLHAQARTSAHADNTTPTTETPAALLLRAEEHADHLRETLKGLDALLLLLHGIEGAKHVDMQGPALAYLLQPLQDKAMGHAEELLQLTDLDRLKRAHAAHHTGPLVTHGLLDVQNHAHHLQNALSGIEALFSLLHAPDNARLPDHLTHALAHLLQPLHDQAADHTEAVQEALQQARTRHKESPQATAATNTAQGARHA